MTFRNLFPWQPDFEGHILHPYMGTGCECRSSSPWKPGQGHTVQMFVMSVTIATTRHHGIQTDLYSQVTEKENKNI